MKKKKRIGRHINSDIILNHRFITPGCAQKQTKTSFSSWNGVCLSIIILPFIKDFEYKFFRPNNRIMFDRYSSWKYMQFKKFCRFTSKN